MKVSDLDANRPHLGVAGHVLRVHRPPTWLTPAAAGVALLLLLGGVAACGDRTGQADLELKLMSFNIRWEISGRDGPNGWPHRREMVFRLLRDADLDVAGLQEATPTQIADIRAAVPDMEVHDADEAMNGIAILYRVDRFRRTDSGAFWFSPTPDVRDSRDWSSPTRRHVCAWVRLVDIASGRAFYVYDLHLDLAEPSRRFSAVLLGERVAGRPTSDPAFILGDFNAPETEAASQYLRGEITLGSLDTPRRTPEPLVDTFRLVHPEATNIGTGHRFRGLVGGPKIDYVYVTRGVKVVAAEIDRYCVDGAYPSDHFPVTAVVRLTD